MQRIFKICSIFTLVIMIISQIITFFHVDKTDLSEGYDVNGIPLETETYTFKTGYVEISLTEPTDGSLVYLFINGEEFSNFENNIIKIDVKENDYIEVVNFSIIDNSIKGEISGKSGFFDEKYLNPSFASDDGRAFVGRICLK